MPVLNNEGQEMTAQFTLPIVNELRHSGWISGNTNEESDAPYRAADTIAALYEALEPEQLLYAGQVLKEAGFSNLGGKVCVIAAKQAVALKQARGEA